MLLTKKDLERCDNQNRGGLTMPNNDITKALQILEKFEFFGGQRAGRELWNDKPIDVQNKDIEDFVKDIAFLKNLINRLEAENERLKKVNERLRKAFEKLCKRTNKLETQLDDKCDICVLRDKAEAYKEFADRLKQVFWSNAMGDVIVREIVDKLLKEMVGE